MRRVKGFQYLSQSCLGMRILFFFMDTPSKQYNSSFINQNCWSARGSTCLKLGKLFWMFSINAWHFLSVAAVAIILSHITALTFVSCAYADIIEACMACSICWAVSLVAALISVGDPQCLEVQLGGTCLMQNLYINDCSLKSNKWGFFIFSRTWSENIFTSGW